MKERELPEGWNRSTLLAAVGGKEEYIVGGPFGSNLKVIDYQETGVPIIRLQNIDYGRFVDKDIKFVSAEKANDLKYHSFYSGDLVLSKLGEPIGKTCIVPENMNYGIVISDVVRIRNRNSFLDSKYLMYQLNSPSCLNQLNGQTFGTTRLRVNLKQVRDLSIVIPPIETQRKIVAILERAEHLRRLRAEADALTQQLVQSVFLEMFGDPVTNQKEWDTIVLGEIGKIVTGNTPSRECSEYYGNYIEWIKSDNINTPYTYLTKSKEMLSIEGAKVGRIAPAGSVLITCIAGSISCIGNAAIANRDVAFNQQINAIIPNEKVNSLFLYHVILNSKRYLQNFSTQSMKGMISKGLLSSIPIIVPPIDIQCHFAKFELAIENINSKQQNSHRYINSLSDALMSKAFTGELVSN